MSPRQLLEKLEKLGIVDSAILEKIRKEVENPEKTVKPKAVLSYLVKKNQLTEQQAIQLLKAEEPTSKAPTTTPKTEDELTVVQPVEKDYDTDDLTGLVMEPEQVVEAEPETVEPEAPIEVDPIIVEDYGATIIDDGGFANQVDPEIMVTEGGTVAPVAYGGLVDEEFGDGSSQSGGHATQSGENEIVYSFQGKRNKKDQWSTKWLYIGFGILGVLLIGVAVLWIVNMGQKPEDMFAAAMDSFNKGSFADATKKFEDYLDQYPDHKDAPTARARRIHSIIRGTYGLKNWSEVIQQSQSLLPDLEEEGEKLNLLREDLAVMLPRSLVEISKKATRVSDLPSMEKDLETIAAYRSVVENPVYIPNSLRKPPSINDNYLRIDNNIRMLEGQIDKEKRYNADLASIRAFREARKTNEAFEIFRKLTRNYGDLASRDELRELMVSISETEQELVLPVELDLPNSTEERPTIIQSTVVLATKSGTPVPGLTGEIVSFLADGSVYGVDAGAGSVIWRRFVGYETAFQPIPINDETLAVSDQQKHELMAVDKDTGRLKWRTKIDEPFLLPTIGDQVLVVTTESGKVIELNATSGEVVKAVQIPQSTNINATVATREPYLYQLGSQQNLYVLSKQDYSCAEVFYLGHYEGSIAVPPQIWTGYILVAINGGDFCNLHVLKPQNNGLGLELVQVISSVVEGTVSMPIQRFGRWMLLTSDKGEMKILELYPAEEQNPVRELTQDVFDAKGGQRAFLEAEGSNLWIAGQGIMRYRIQRNLGEFGREILLEPNDTFISPVQKLDDYVLHVRRRNQSGMISVSLVDAMTLKPVWRTDIGGELAGPPMPFGEKVVAVSNQGDMFSIDASAEARGYLDNPVRASEVIENLKFTETIRLTEDTFAAIGPANRKDLLLAQGTTGKSKLMALAKPADQPACRPVTIGGDLIIPTSTGQVARVDPVNGRMIGTPFQPPIQPSATKPPWFEPTVISEYVLAIGSGITDLEGSKSKLYVLNGANNRVLEKVEELELESPLKSRLVNDGQHIFGVIAGETNDNLTSFPVASPLAVGRQSALEGRQVAGPWMTDAGILVLVDNDRMYCFGSDLSPKWSIDVPNIKLACQPEVVGAQLMICFRNGQVSLIDPTTGKPGTQFDVGQPIIHQPYRVGQKMYFGGLDGTVHIVDLGRLSRP